MPALGILLAALAVSGSPVAAEAPGDSVRAEPLAISAAVDFGQIVQGRSVDPAANLDGQFLQRTGVWLTQRATLKERLSLTIGVGGMFWYALPEQASVPGSMVTRFGPGISQAFGTFAFGDPRTPSALLQMGYFPFKYNPDAQNLGEYLLRSGTYPGILVTGGWNIISNAAYMMQGLRLAVPAWDGRLRADFLLPMERDLPPMYSLSPTALATVQAFPGVEVGAGVAWNHGIPIRPSKESPHVEGNRIVVSRTLNPDTAAVGEGAEYYLYAYDSTRFYTFQGLKLAARIGIDPKAWFGAGPLGPRDLRIYAEAAVLGWQNYPFYYEKRSERMPVMAGFNLPAFGFLDVLSIEVQHYGSPFENSMYQAYLNQTPIWTVEDPSLGALGKGYPAVAAVDARQRRRAARDDWKWSVYAKKEVFTGIRLYAQLASDHMRPTDINQNPFYVPVTNRNGKDWYYLMRLEMGI